jgi:hypothetical protein
MIFKRHENGLEESGAMKRFGRKILIDKDKFFKWINSLPNKDYSHNTVKEPIEDGINQITEGG